MVNGYVSRKKTSNVYNTVSILFCGCETWQLRLENKLLAVEMGFRRRSAGNSRIREERVREIMKAGKTIADEVQSHVGEEKGEREEVDGSQMER